MSLLPWQKQLVCQCEIHALATWESLSSLLLDSVLLNRSWICHPLNCWSRLTSRPVASNEVYASTWHVRGSDLCSKCLQHLLREGECFTERQVTGSRACVKVHFKKTGFAKKYQKEIHCNCLFIGHMHEVLPLKKILSIRRAGGGKIHQFHLGPFYIVSN